MTCLTVKSSIHPISKPTGTDDDMGGNDKADALARLTWNGADRCGGVQRNLFRMPGHSTGIGFYDISRTGLHLHGTQKKRVWPNRDIALHSRATAGNVTAARGLQSERGRISSLNRKIIVL